MKWIRRGVVALLALVSVVITLAYTNAIAASSAVGFQLLRASTPSGDAFPVAVWYPTDARAWPTTQIGPVLMRVARNGRVVGTGLPMVILSHGNGGSVVGHADLAMALAAAGYVVAAPMHVGDNAADQRRAGRATLFHERAEQLRATVTALLTQWSERARVDSTRIGAFGFSAGAVTVLAAAGAQPDLHRVASHCAQAREFVCDVFAAVHSPLAQPGGADALPPFAQDARIRAIVLAAPGLGFTMDSAAVATLTVPVQLWSGDADRTVPFATNAAVILAALGARAESHRVPRASHVSFLAPCGVVRPANLCTDPDGFRRREFHASMNATVIAFFDAQIAQR